MGNTCFFKMISLGLRVDKSKKIKICCQDMKEEDYCLLISKDKEIYAYNYECGHLTFPEPIQYCPWCGTKIELIPKDIAIFS
ncbi:MAG: hypothetical protein M3044_04765 [Thermoproteota archaeon]|nr:hypothetical protein [Thermoproteota archaeon]